jgi:hypothetical protein
MIRLRTLQYLIDCGILDCDTVSLEDAHHTILCPGKAPSLPLNRGRATYILSSLMRLRDHLPSNLPHITHTTHSISEDGGSTLLRNVAIRLKGYAVATPPLSSSISAAERHNEKGGDTN